MTIKAITVGELRRFLNSQPELNDDAIVAATEAGTTCSRSQARSISQEIE